MQSIQLRHGQYAIDRYGTSGPLLLFGHGLYFDRTMFADVARSLATQCRCICLDWPGHGGSPARTGGWTVQDLVDDIPELLDALGERDAVLVGLSQGAAVFTRTALQHPSRVRALVAMDATPLAQDPAVMQRSESTAEVLLRGTDAQVGELLDKVLGRMFSPHTVAHAPAVIASARTRMLSHARDALASAVRLGRSYQTITDQFPTLYVPTLVLWGEDDQVSAPALIDHYRAIPGAVVKTIPNAGHSLVLEQPDAVVDAVRGFLAAHRIHQGNDE